jgi:NhaA family Na+:H+ antiporter
VYLPLALAIWGFVHAGGVHATVAGVAMGLLMRVTEDDGEHESPGERMEHLTRPVSAGLAVPVFALMAAGISISPSLFGQVFTQRLPLAIVAAMLVGKTFGVFGGAYLTARFTRAQLSEELAWGDVFGVAILAGVGFTVSLLISWLAFKDPSTNLNLAKTAVLTASVIAAALAALVLRRRDRYYRELESEAE